MTRSLQETAGPTVDTTRVEARHLGPTPGRFFPKGILVVFAIMGALVMALIILFLVKWPFHRDKSCTIFRRLLPARCRSMAFGMLQVRAKTSDATTGVKSFLVKALNPFLQNDHPGVRVPISITGTYDHPSYRVASSAK
jgi:hypothetical protein